VFALQMAALAGAPVVFATAVLRGGFARSGAIEELGVWLGTSEAARPGLQDAVAGTLGDPSVRLLFWLGEPGYVDGAGAPAELPPAGSDRAAVEVELADARIGAIAYDARLIAEPELVRAAGRVIALALERDRLTAQLLASRDALRESRARIVHASDQERRRIARDLHDGLQGRLVALAVQAGRIVSDSAAPDTPERAEALRAGVLDAVDELRGLVHGVMPALLTERGLCAATVDLVDRLPVPTRLELADLDDLLPEPVQSAGYFILAEALTNAVKHSRARELAVRAWQDGGQLRIEVADDGIGGATLGLGSGLSGLVDRLDALGGHLRIDSPPGEGTLVAAELPCG
jgi:signal transduction histidine kinase